MTGLAPAGWPRDLAAPGSAPFTHEVVAWLLDRGPGELRTSDLRRYPLALAWYVEHHVDGALAGARAAYAQARTALAPLGPADVEVAQRAIEAEGARLTQVLREVRLVRGALLMALPDESPRP